VSTSTRSYLDHAASSPMVPAVAAAMGEVLLLAGNPNSLHQSGRSARRVLAEARESLAADLGAQPDEIVFTSGGTEANNLALLGAPRQGRPLVAISAIEHPSVAEFTARCDAVRVLPVAGDGQLQPGALSELGTDVALVSVMWVNNETGAIQPLGEVVAAAHAVGAWAHSDAVQAFGHLPVNFAESGLDLLSVSAHKLGGPVGVGALVVRRGVKLTPVGFGGGQEAKLRSGTVPVALAHGFAVAARLAVSQRDSEAARLAGLKARLAAGLDQIDRSRLNSAAKSSPAILNATFSGTRADDLLLLLDAAGIDASTGSACTAGLHQPSEVLLAMGRSASDARASLRFSFGWSTTQADIDRLLAVLPGAVAQARKA
jgi:cysteine desulfurase